MYVHTSGYILKSMDWREGDRLYSIFTDELGKIEAQARGVRKIKSKLAGHLQPFGQVTLHLARGKVFYQIIGAQRETSHVLAGDERKFGYGMYFLELVDRMTKVGQKNDVIYELLTDTFTILETLEDREKLKQLRIAFLLKLLNATGFNPEERITRDEKTQEELRAFLAQPLSGIAATDSNGSLQSLFSISQYALNEVVERPLQSAKYLQSLA